MESGLVHMQRPLLPTSEGTQQRPVSSVCKRGPKNEVFGFLPYQTFLS